MSDKLPYKVGEFQDIQPAAYALRLPEGLYRAALSGYSGPLESQAQRYPGYARPPGAWSPGSAESASPGAAADYKSRRALRGPGAAARAAEQWTGSVFRTERAWAGWESTPGRGLGQSKGYQILLLGLGSDLGQLGQLLTFLWASGREGEGTEALEGHVRRGLEREAGTGPPAGDFALVTHLANKDSYAENFGEEKMEWLEKSSCSPTN